MASLAAAALRIEDDPQHNSEPLCGVDEQNLGCRLGAPFEGCEGPGCNAQYSLFVFPVLALTLGVVVKPLEKHLRVPYTLLLLVIGIFLGVMGCTADLGLLGTSLHQWVHLDPPSAFFFWFLAPLIFEASFNSDFHIFRKIFFQILTLSFLMVMIQMVLIAVFQLYVVRSPDFNWYSALMFGAMLSATDPIAVTATLRSIGASEQLGTLIEGESLLNDGSAFVLFEAFFKNVIQPNELSVGEIVVEVVRLSLGGVAMGLAFGLAAAVILSFTYEMFEVEISMTIVVAFLGFWVAQSPARVSGVICNVTSGLVLSALGKPLISPSIREPMSHFWELLAFIANTIVFVYAGVLVVAFAWSCSGETLELRDYFLTFAWYLWLQLIRVGSIFLLWPLLKFRQRWFKWRHALAVGLSGLRGAISLILALEVGEVSSSVLSPQVSSRIVFWTCALVALSLLLNGLIVKPLLHWLRLDTVNPTKEEFVWRAKGVMLQRTLQLLDSISMDALFKTASWKTVVDNTVPSSWLSTSYSADRAYARMSLETGSLHRNDSTNIRCSLSSRQSVGTEMFTQYVPRKSIDLADLEMRRPNSPGLLSDGEEPQSPSVVSRPTTKENLSVLDAVSVPVRDGVNGSTSIPRHDTYDSLDEILDDGQEFPQARRSVVYNTLRRVLGGRSVQNIAGEDVDIEVRRRYLVSLLRDMRLAYEVSVLEFGVLQALQDDIKTALDHNEEGEPYTLFEFLNQAKEDVACFQATNKLFANVPTRTRMMVLNFVLAAVVEALKDPYLKESRLVFSEAEELYESTSLHLNHLEALDQRAFAFVQSDAAIRYVYQKQEEVLYALRRDSIVDEDDYRAIKHDLVSLQRHYFLLVLRFRRFSLPTEDEIICRTPLLQPTICQSVMDSGGIGRRVHLKGNQRLSRKLKPGVVLVIAGAVKVVGSLLGEEREVAEHGSMSCNEEDEELELVGTGEVRASLSLETRDHVTMHWCFPQHSVIVHPGVFSASIGKHWDKTNFPPVRGCDVMGRSGLLVIGFDKAVELAKSTNDFRLESARAIARMVALEYLSDEPPYSLSHTAESSNEGNEDTASSRASTILRQLPYTDIVTIGAHQNVLIRGPGVLLCGSIVISSPEESLGAGQMQSKTRTVEAPATLPGGLFTVDVAPPEGEVDSSSGTSRETRGCTAELLVVPVETVEQSAIGRTQHWKAESVEANGRFGAHRHVDMR